MHAQADIHVTGIVQGVGFRPFVYREAVSLSLVGYVLNLGDAGVRIVVEGTRARIEKLIDSLHNNPPSISRVDSVDVSWTDATGAYKSFIISKSSISRKGDSVTEIPPDIAICNDCITDLFEPTSRWYHYPFTSCAACGPRYSTITGLPYDRPNTTMVQFPLCDTCNTGYTDPLDRRYHAQTTACEKCGPRYRLVNSKGETISTDESIVKSAEFLRSGLIIAIHGIGGTHLATTTSNPTPIRELRRRKKRSHRPFAIMARNLDAVREISEPTKDEIDLLASWRRPIVLVKQRDNIDIRFETDLISPGLDTIGIMLPYAPMHHLLFHHLEEPTLVLTSANPTGVPMYIDPSTIISSLRDVADYHLIHNRQICQRVDDSVIKSVSEKHFVFLRRARGYVPDPIRSEIPAGGPTLLAVGPEEKVTGSILKSGVIYPTQHIGDTDRTDTLDFLNDAINHLKHLLGIREFQGVACDLHPEFLTTELAEEISRNEGIPIHRIQHHHSHLAGMIVDHGLAIDTRIICITADGYGYGDDGTAWGGEILAGDLVDYSRMGGLTPKVLPGGDLSARFAARSLLGIMSDQMEIDEVYNLVEGYDIAPGTTASVETLSLLADTMTQRINTVESSSTGRVLDAISIILGICGENTYDGECPMKLEAIARQCDIKIEPEFRHSKKMMHLDTTDFVRKITELKMEKHPVSDIAYAAQWSLGSALAQMACEIAERDGSDSIGFSGGVALNRIITESVIDTVRHYDKQVLIHSRVPPGDGGVSIGQVAVALRRVTME